MKYKKIFLASALLLISGLARNGRYQTAGAFLRQKHRRRQVRVARMDIDVEIGGERPYGRTPERFGHRVPALFAHEQRGLLSGSKIHPMPEPAVRASEARRTGCERPESPIDRLSDDHPPLFQPERLLVRPIIAIPLPPELRPLPRGSPASCHRAPNARRSAPEEPFGGHTLAR